MKRTDVVVIGAGPAGLSAAARIAETSTARVLVIDEGPSPGGRLKAQLYRHGGNWFIGAEHARKLAARAESAGVEICSGKQVWSLDRGTTSEPVGSPSSKQRFTLALDDGDTLASDCVVIATGAAERALGLPGWTTPGVVAVGAVQSMLNEHRVVPGVATAVIGIDPLSLAIVDEMKVAGVEAQGIYLPPPCDEADDPSGSPVEVLKRLADLHRLAPNRLLGTLMRFLRFPGIARTVAALWPRGTVRLAGMPIHLRECVVGIDGTDEVTGIRVRRVSAQGRLYGPVKRVSVDSVCLSGGLYPLQELTRDCELVDVPELGGRVPLHGPDLETTVPGLFVAGNITGIESAEVARTQGELVGAAIARYLHAEGPTSAAGGAHPTVEAARAAVVAARASVPLTFLPRIHEGRQHMARLWQETLL